MKEISMSIQDFINVQNGNITYEELYKRERIVKKIMRNRKLKSMAVLVIGSMLYCEKAIAAASTDPIDKGGTALLLIVRRFGYYVCVIMGIVEIIKALMQGDQKSIGKITIKYSVAFASFYFLPWLFDIIKEFFE